jgi:hypothetical protein
MKGSFAALLRRRVTAVLAAAGLAGVATAAAAQTAPRVELFSPEGTTRGVRQVTARFSAPMVPLGDPRPAADPFEVECASPGRSRWADPRTWVFTFDAELPAGLRCRFTLRPRLRTLAGAAVAGRRRFAFSTGGPAVLDIVPSGGPVVEDQRFAVKLDAEPTRASLERHAFVRIAGLPDPVGLRVLEGGEREEILRRLDWKPDDPRHLVLEARQRFAPGAKLVLGWGAGIETGSGVATDSTQRFEFEVRPAFTARLVCERENARADCVPLAPLRLLFSAPLAWDAAARIVLRAEGGGAGPGWPALRRWPGDGDPLVDVIEFRGPFPPRALLRAEIPADLADDAGRPLERGAGSNLALRTAGYPPLAKFAARFGVIESASPVLPVTLRRVGPGPVAGAFAARRASLAGADPAAIRAWLDATARARPATSVLAEPRLGAAPAELALPPAPEGEETEVVGVPLPGPGLHVVEIESRVLGEALLDPPAPMYVAAAALVTNLGVHFKWGDESSLVWVTSLGRAEPVAGARVRVASCRGEVLAEAVTDADGIARVAGLPLPDDAPECTEHGWSDYASGLLVLAESAGDLGLVHTSWSEGIEPWRFGLPTEWRPRTARVHAILDRTLFRAGETLHTKLVLRRAVQAGFAAVPPAERPETLRIVHLGTQDSWELPLAWGAGSAVLDWTIPKQAKLGIYEMRVSRRGQEDWEAETAGSFRVEEFRVPLLRATIQPLEQALVSPSEVPFDLAVQYLAGGGASSLPVVLRSQLRKRAASEFPDWEGFAFSQGGVKEGVRTRRFGEGELDYEREWEWGEGGALGLVWRRGEGPAAARGPVSSQELVLDAAGTGRAVVSGLPKADEPLELQAELEFRDPSGEVKTASRKVPIWPAARTIGLRTTPATTGRELVRLQAGVLDLEGEPIWRARVEVEAFERRSYAARKRLVGGFYAYEDVEEVKRLGPFCQGRTDRRGAFACEGPPPASGEIVFVARTRDGEGRQSVTQTTLWVPGSDESWFAQGEGDRMDVLPARPRYEPGDTARFQVRMPFREATALVTVEREGVGESFVTRLSGRDPEVKLRLGGHHAPNVFVSVLAVRGRVDEPVPTALVDLARPAWRLGVSEIKVGGERNELDVRVEPERSTWRVRETAKVKVTVRTPDGTAPPPGSEIALAAVDEGLLELAPNGSWRLLDAMLGRRSHAVRTSTAWLQLVGRRHYGRKALPAGGGGGQRPTRELFDTLLLWRARVPLDERGEARVEIPLSDSLTAFRIAAVGTAGDALFGSGEASIRTTQDLMVLSGLPPLVRGGDRFAAGFTVRNTTGRTKDVTLRPRVEGLAAPLGPVALRLKGGEAQETSFDVEVPAAAPDLVWELDVEAEGAAADRLRVAQRVVPAVPERVLQATLVQVKGAQSVPVERPADALPERGGLAVALRPRLGEGRDAIQRAMREYPYTCLEQLASVAVALRDPERWGAAMALLPAHLDDDGLARFFSGPGPGSEVLTSYLLSVAQESGWEIPEAPRQRMLGALERFVTGSLMRREVWRAVDLPLRKLAAADALARHGRATPELVAALPVEPNLLTDAALLDWISLLERVPGAARRDARLAEADRLLRARLDVQGTSLGFRSARGGLVDWLLATPDVNAARLVLSRLAAPAWREDLPRLLRAALSLQRRGAWPTTTANAWGALALEKFSRSFEAAGVGGETSATVAAAEASVAWGSAPEGDVLRLPWPAARSLLELRHNGSGAPWAVVQGVGAVPLRAPLESGYRITKRLEPVVQRTPGSWSRGDVVSVRLEIVADADASWVVVSDPIPAGASILGSGLGGDSGLLAAGEREGGFAWPAFTERGQEAWRRYYEFVPEGRIAAEYTLRLGQAGRFLLPPTRAEAMYAPERMGEIPNEPLEVLP